MPDFKILVFVDRDLFTKVLVPGDQGLGLDYIFKGLDNKSASYQVKPKLSFRRLCNMFPQ